MRVTDKDELSDAVLFERLAIGDQKAFHFLLKKYLPSILRTAQRMLGDANAADDVAQEVMVRLWKKAKSWDQNGPAKLETWLYRITMNLCIDRYRERTHLPIEHLEFIATDAKSALAHVHEKQVEQIILNLFEGLSQQQRMVIVLSYYEGMSAPQIAEVLDTTPGAVAQLLHRGRNTLKDKLVELGIEGWINDRH